MSTYAPRTRGAKAHPPWTEADLEHLVLRFNAGEKVRIIARDMKRRIGTVRVRLGHLRKAGRIGNRNPNRWPRDRYYVKRTPGADPWLVKDRESAGHFVRRFAERQPADAFAAFLNSATLASAEQQEITT